MKNQVFAISLLIISLLIVNGQTDFWDNVQKSFKDKDAAERWNHTWLVTAENYLNCIAKENQCCFKVGIVKSQYRNENGSLYLTFQGETNCRENTISGKTSSYQYDISLLSSMGVATLPLDITYFGGTVDNSPIYADDKTDASVNPHYAIKLPSDQKKITKDNILNVLLDAHYFKSVANSTSALLGLSFALLIFYLFI